MHKERRADSLDAPALPLSSEPVELVDNEGHRRGGGKACSRTVLAIDRKRVTSRWNTR